MHRRRFIEGLAALMLGVPAAASAQSLDDFVTAVRNDNVAVVRAALARGMDANSVGRDGWPVLAVAAREGNVRTVEALLAAGAKPDARNPFGDTPLMLASLQGHLDVAKQLRAKGAALDYPGWTPLIYAATGGHDQMVRYLLGEGARIDARAPNGTSALMMAVREARFSTAVLLIERGANVGLSNDDGATALSWAQQQGDAELVARLTKAGARP